MNTLEWLLNIAFMVSPHISSHMPASVNMFEPLTVR